MYFNSTRIKYFWSTKRREALCKHIWWKKYWRIVCLVKFVKVFLTSIFPRVRYNNSYLATCWVVYNLISLSSEANSTPMLWRGLGEGGGEGHLPQMPHAGSANAQRHSKIMWSWIFWWGCSSTRYTRAFYTTVSAILSRLSVLYCRYKFFTPSSMSLQNLEAIILSLFKIY